MKLAIIALSVTFLLAAPVAAKDGATSNSGSSDATSTDMVTNEKATKKPKKITDRRHPDYVRCRSEAIIGSLTRKRRICMTNAEWVVYTRTGSRDAKLFVEDMQSGQNTSN